MKTLEPNMTNLKPIEKECRRADGVTVYYSLYRLSTPCQEYYAIEICAEEEAEMQIVGHHHDRAQRIFELMFNEHVTPCTLAEILHDLLTEEEILYYSQNLSHSPKETLYKFR